MSIISKNYLQQNKLKPLNKLNCLITFGDQYCEKDSNLFIIHLLLFSHFDACLKYGLLPRIRSISFIIDGVNFGTILNVE